MNPKTQKSPPALNPTHSALVEVFCTLYPVHVPTKASLVATLQTEGGSWGFHRLKVHDLDTDNLIQEVKFTNEGDVMGIDARRSTALAASAAFRREVMGKPRPLDPKPYKTGAKG